MNRLLFKNVRYQKAFTLVETIIIMAMMIVFLGTLFSAMIAGLRYWTDGRLRLRAQEALRESLDTMTMELRQAIPNPDPGTNGNGSTGYLALSPAVDPTGIIFPNRNVQQTDYITFTEPNVQNYNPSVQNWSEVQPQNYHKVKYFIDNGVLKRQIISYNANGLVASDQTDNVVKLQDGSLSMQVNYLSETLVSIRMTATLNKFSYTIFTKVKTGG